jgi:hypothetical protein
MNLSKIFTSLVFFVTISSNTYAANESLPEVTVDGLHRVDGTKMALVYAKPGTDLSQYNRIYLTTPQIAFAKNWQRTQNSIPNQHVSTDDMQRIKSELAVMFTEVFKQELQNNGGYVLVDGIAEDVLTIHPAIVDLNVFAPDTPGTRGTRSAIASVGSMGLYMELIDSVTGDVIIKAYDNKYDRTRTRIQAPNNVRNKAAATEMLGEWAKLLRLALDEARTVVK